MVFHSNEALLLCQGNLRVELHLFYGSRAFGQIWETGAKCPKIMCKDTRRVIKTLQLHISHQMRLCPSVKVSWRLPFTCFTCIWALWSSGEPGPKYPQIMCRDTRKVIQSLQLHISHQVRPYSSVETLCW